MAVKVVIEPIFELNFQPCSYGFRPKRSAHDAIEVIRQMANWDHDWMMDADIENYFETIDHRKLIEMYGSTMDHRNREVRMRLGWIRLSRRPAVLASLTGAAVSPVRL